MPTTYQLADADVTDLLARWMRLEHPRLRDAGVKVGVLMAYNPDGPALKRNGYEVLAMIRPVPLKDRVTKGYDAELLIDERKWRDLRDEHRAAAVDHELSHIDTIDLSPEQLKAARREDSAAPTWKLDDLGRPKLRSVPGDWDAGDGFKTVVRRHGAFAVEYLNLANAKGKADAARKEGEAERAAG